MFFFVDIFKNETTKLGKTARLVFKITQHIRDEELMKSLIKYFEAGNVFKNREIIDFRVTKINELNEKLIPFFEKYKIVGSKFQDYSNFKKVAELMKNKVHLTYEGLEEIQKIKTGMNKGRQ